jgi:hypothetical protein
MQNFAICVPFWNEIAHFYDPPITLAKTTFKLDEKVLKFWKFALFGLFRSRLSRKP